MSLSDDEFLEMRRAFRGMQDEEPPAGGLAELMAAARTKAVEMAPAKVEAEKIPWWRVLLRPPVLALASVVVLVGGAVLIGRHDETKSAVEPTAGSALSRAPEQQEPAREAKSAPAEIAPAEIAPGASASGAAYGSGLSSDGKIVRDTPDPARAKDQPRADPRAADDRPTDGIAPPRNVDKGKLDVATKADKADKATAAAPPPPPAPVATPTPPTNDPAPRGAPEPKLSAKKDSPRSPGSPRSVEEASGKAGDVKQGNAESANDDGDSSRSRDSAPVTTTETTSATRRGPKAPSVEQLVSQCQSAANRNDCQTVKLLAKTIEKQDPSSYRERVQKNDAIVRCLSAK